MPRANDMTPMSASEVRVAVLENNERMNARWDERVKDIVGNFERSQDEHEKRTCDRFDRQDLRMGKAEETSDAIYKRLSELDHTVRDSFQTLLELQLEAERRQGDRDVKEEIYRQQIHAWRDDQVPKIEQMSKDICAVDGKTEACIKGVGTNGENIEKLRIRIDVLRYLITSVAALGTSMRLGFRVLSDGKAAATWIAATGSSCITVYGFFHIVLPWLRHMGRK